MPETVRDAWELLKHTPILKVHGCVSEPSSIVLSQSGCVVVLLPLLPLPTLLLLLLLLLLYACLLNAVAGTKSCFTALPAIKHSLQASWQQVPSFIWVPPSATNTSTISALKYCQCCAHDLFPPPPAQPMSCWPGWSCTDTLVHLSIDRGFYLG
jgi:hypothetical protein